MNRINASKGSITISTTINRELWEQARKHNISWSEALRTGLTFILSKITEDEYKNPLQYERKIETLAKKLEEFAREKNELQEELYKHVNKR